jgi:hypothetical protein
MTRLITALLLLPASAAFAQDPVDLDRERTETIRLVVSGSLDLDWVWRDEPLSAARGGVNFGDPDGEGVAQGFANVRLDIDVSEHVRLVLDAQTKRVEPLLPFDNAPAILGPAAEGLGTFVREASITIRELFDPGVTAVAGASPWAFDLRGRGALFWDPANSKSMTTNAFSAITGGSGAAVQMADQLQPTGVLVHYDREQLHATVAFLPAIIEGGSNQDDEAGYVLAGTYDLGFLGKGSRAGAILALSSLSFGGGGESRLFTFGAGGTVLDLLLDGLEIFGEAYLQGGSIGSLASGATVDARGYAAQFGARLVGDQDGWPVWIELKYTYLSGDKEQTAGDRDCDAFLSYENVDDLLVLEDDLYGLDWDTNLACWKLSAGISFPDERVEVSLTLGFARAPRDVTFGAQPEEKGLGRELDLRIAWAFTRQVTLDVAGGFLIDSKVLEAGLGGAAVPRADDAASVVVLGMNARF